MRTTIGIALALLMLAACSAEQRSALPAQETASSTDVPTETVVSSTEVATETTTTPATEAPAAELANENQQAGTWTGQIKVGQPVSMFNYVGAESGDFAPMRFDNDSEVGKKILAVCGDDDACEFTGVVEWLDETPPTDASAIGRIVRVDSVKRVPRAP